MKANDQILLEGDDNLIAHTSWNEQGFTVGPFLSERDYTQLCDGVRRIVRRLLERLRIQSPDDFSLEHYHRVIGRSDALHHSVVKQIARGFALGKFPIDPALVSNRISEICGISLTPSNPSLRWLPVSSSRFHLRIVRPFRRDYNPLHRDVWINRLRNAVNIYVPVAGSTAQSSLGVVPGSHLWRESDIEKTPRGAAIHGQAYTVPAVTGAKKSLSVIRPNPGPNEALVFSPYLIHGEGSNQNEGLTRVSLEMRFWRRKFIGAFS